MSGPVRFSLDVSSPFAAELLDSLIEAGEKVGCHAIWGHIHGDSLEIVASDEIPQSLVCAILSAKLKLKHPSTNGPVLGVSGPSFSRSSADQTGDLER